MNRTRVMIVDDHQVVRAGLRTLINGQPDLVRGGRSRLRPRSDGTAPAAHDRRAAARSVAARRVRSRRAQTRQGALRIGGRAHPVAPSPKRNTGSTYCAAAPADSSARVRKNPSCSAPSAPSRAAAVMSAPSSRTCWSPACAATRMPRCTASCRNANSRFSASSPRASRCRKSRIAFPQCQDGQHLPQPYPREDVHEE